MLKKIAILFFILNCSIYSVDDKWFQVWDRPEYIEDAKPIEGGYLLNIIRVEKGNNFLVVKAKLLFADKGLPSFEVIEQLNFSGKAKAIEQFEKWSEGKIKSKL